MPSNSKKLPPTTRVATIVSLATSGVTPEALNIDGVDTKVLDRIRKCLERAHHHNTPEAEAKAALRMASRLMAQYNVTQTEVLAAADTSERLAQLGGQSVVRITSKKADGRATNQTWVNDLTDAIETFFDCKSYSTDMSKSIEWTFYGIAANTAAAAISFEMCHNLILEWARRIKNVGPKNSYCLGVTDGLYEIALKEKEQEEEDARKKEQEDLKIRIQQDKMAREDELRRLATTIEDGFEDDASSNQDISGASVLFEPSSYSQMDVDETWTDAEIDREDDAFMEYGDETMTTFKEEDEEPLNPFDDFEAQLRSVMQHQNTDTKPSNEEQKIKLEDFQDKFPTVSSVDFVVDSHGDENAKPLVAWASCSTLVLFRQKSKDVADEYLRSQGVKLSKGRARNGTVCNYDAYLQGEKDSKEIDPRRRRIDNAV